MSTIKIDRGPSPPARGSPVPVRRLLARRGSIPACAGEPRTDGQRRKGARVHPRLRGGAERRAQDGDLGEGPSPPARGSPLALPAHEAAEGSIPACAGEPRGESLARVRSGVHPRLRGGAVATEPAPIVTLGPSPPARGSRCRAPRPCTDAGSIPACAGEPGSRTFTTRATWVHPRLRGGAPPLLPLARRSGGPSPPARGSLDRLAGDSSTRGSIPACAGEPTRRPWRSFTAGVHPRLRGGAPRAEAVRVMCRGPSPPARGSPAAGSDDGVGDGSIPACAGEPPRSTRCGHPGRVHPRLRGGAGRLSHP